MYVDTGFFPPGGLVSGGYEAGSSGVPGLGLGQRMGQFVDSEWLVIESCLPSVDPIGLARDYEVGEPY